VRYDALHLRVEEPVRFLPWLDVTVVPGASVQPKCVHRADGRTEEVSGGLTHIPQSPIAIPSPQWLWTFPFQRQDIETSTAGSVL